MSKLPNSIILYEIRIFEKNQMRRLSADNLTEVLTIIKEAQGKKCRLYKVEKSLDGTILNSEELKCHLYKNSFVIQTIKIKPFVPKPQKPKPVIKHIKKKIVPGPRDGQKKLYRVTKSKEVNKRQKSKEEDVPTQSLRLFSKDTSTRNGSEKNKPSIKDSSRIRKKTDSGNIRFKKVSTPTAHVTSPKTLRGSITRDTSTPKGAASGRAGASNRNSKQKPSNRNRSGAASRNSRSRRRN